MVLTGFHHLTAITADAPGNHRFYTRLLGMRVPGRDALGRPTEMFVGTIGCVLNIRFKITQKHKH